jgi:hypothetical protein
VRRLVAFVLVQALAVRRQWSRLCTSTSTQGSIARRIATVFAPRSVTTPSIGTGTLEVALTLWRGTTKDFNARPRQVFSLQRKRHSRNRGVREVLRYRIPDSVISLVHGND